MRRSASHTPPNSASRAPWPFATHCSRAAWLPEADEYESADRPLPDPVPNCPELAE